MKPNQILSLAIVSLLILSIPKSLKSQTQEGNWLVEGNLGNINLSNNKNELTYETNTYKSEERIRNVSLFPRVGYFINNNFVLGATVNLRYQSNRSTSYRDNGVKSNDGITRNGSIGLSPFVRYYFTQNSKNRLYGQLGGGIDIDIIGNSKGTSYWDNGDTYSTNKSTSEGNNISGEALIGFNHFLTDNVALNLSVGYNYGKRTRSTTFNSTYSDGTANEPFKTGNTTITGNVVWSLGFTMIIPSKKG